MGKTEDYRQPTTRHFHKKEAHCKVQNHHYVGLQESLSESYMYLGIGTQPEKRTGLWVKKMAGVLTINLITFSHLNLYTDGVDNLTQQDMR